MGRKMTKCTVLLPVFYNDRTLIPVSTTDDLLQELSDEFGGYTNNGEVIGCFGYQIEKMLSVVIAVEPEQVDLLSDMIRCHGYRTKQTCMYFEVIPDAVVLLDSTYADFYRVLDAKGSNNV